MDEWDFPAEVSGTRRQREVTSKARAAPPIASLGPTEGQVHAFTLAGCTIKLKHFICTAVDFMARCEISPRGSCGSFYILILVSSTLNPFPRNLLSVCCAQGQVLHCVADILLRHCQNNSHFYTCVRAHTHTHTEAECWFCFIFFVFSSDLVSQIVEQGKNAKSYHYILANLVSPAVVMIFYFST